MTNPIRTHIVRDWRGGHRLILVRDQDRGSIDILAGFEWVTGQEGDAVTPQDGVGNADQIIQSIVDKAWDAGFRPAGFAEVKNETAAISRHLDDFRTIAFHKLGIPK